MERVSDVHMLSTELFYKKAAEIAGKTDRKLCLITNDVSNFRYINEFYGMDEGDRFIHDMAHYFYIDNPRCLVSCSMGSEQFRGLFDIDGFSNEEETTFIQEKNAQFEEMMNLKYPDIYIHVYTGIYFIPDNKDSIRKAIDCAHYAKKLTKNKYDIKCMVYDPVAFNAGIDSMEVSNMFLNAVNSDRLKMYLQPKMSVSKNKVVGAEALVRIMSEDGEVIPPGKFVPILEQTGMIRTLDQIMVEKVFALQKKWMDMGYSLFTISVNISRVEFARTDFVQFAIDLKNKYQIPPKYIEFEILESSFLGGMQSIMETTKKLREEGFLVSVDDFGSGFSSLNQIANMPADIIKLDHVFASTSLATQKGRAVIRAIIQLLHSINYRIVFEGIETEEQRDLAYSYGCDVIQGFLYSRPIPVEDFELKYVRV